MLELYALFLGVNMNLISKIGSFFQKIIDLIFLAIEEIQNLIESNWLFEKIINITIFIFIIAIFVRLVLKLFSHFTR